MHFIDLEALGREQLARLARVGDADLGQVHVRPASEAVRSVPLRLPVPHQDETGVRLLEGCPRASSRKALHASRRSRRWPEVHRRREQPADAQDAQHAPLEIVAAQLVDCSLIEGTPQVWDGI